MTERRGRPKKQEDFQVRKWEDRYESECGKFVDVWKWDLDKKPNGPISTETIYPKGYRPDKPQVDNNGKLPIVMVFKTSERKNAKWKIKKWSNKNMDQILRGRGIGVPETAIIVELGTGFKFYEEWSNKYKKELK